MIREAISRARKAFTPETIGSKLASRRHDALVAWGDAVRAAASGQEPDLAAVEAAAVSLRISDVARAFQADVDAVRAREEALASVAIAQEQADAAVADYEKARRELHELQARVAEAQRRIDFLPIAGYGVSVAQARVHEIEDGAPRIFAKATLERKRVDGSPEPSDADVEQLAVAGVVSSDGSADEETFWDLSSDD